MNTLHTDLQCLRAYFIFIILPFSPAGKHTASTHRLSALVTPTGHSYVCAAQQTLTLISSDHQKGITVSMYDVQIQPFDIASDFMFSERKNHLFFLRNTATFF